MTTNQTIGLISAICLGLVILWTYLRKDKRVWLRMYDKSASHGTENGQVRVVLMDTYKYDPTDKERLRDALFAKVQNNEIKLNNWLSINSALDKFPEYFTDKQKEVIDNLLQALREEMQPQIGKAFQDFILYGESIVHVPVNLDLEINDISTHKKVLEDIKKVEEGFLGADQEGINWKYVNPTYPYIDVHSHEKVLEDIKKVETDYDSEFVNQVSRRKTI